MMEYVLEEIHSLYLTALLIIACTRLHSDALRNPAELAYCNCEKRVARATSHIAGPARQCSLIVFIA